MYISMNYLQKWFGYVYFHELFTKMVWNVYFHELFTKMVWICIFT